MPRILDPEELVEVEELEHGGPSLPPPRDSDGGGDWGNQPPQGRRGPHDRLRRYRLGLLFAVVSIYTLFIALTSAYVIRQSGGRFDPSTGLVTRDWQAFALPQILWLNTLLLLLSSLTIEVGRERVFREQAVMAEWLGIEKATRKASLPWLAISIVLGFGFLVGQYLAWAQLNREGVYAAGNPASSFFFVLTATHAVHLFGGLIALCWTAGAGFAMSLQSRQIAVDISAWYWHAMGLLWLYIFALLWWLR